MASQDRWGNTALDEARRMGAAPVVAYLEGLLNGENAVLTGTRYRQACPRASSCAAAFMAVCYHHVRHRAKSTSLQGTLTSSALLLRPPPM